MQAVQGGVVPRTSVPRPGQGVAVRVSSVGLGRVVLVTAAPGYGVRGLVDALLDPATDTRVEVDSGEGELLPRVGAALNAQPRGAALSGQLDAVRAAWAERGGWLAITEISDWNEDTCVAELALARQVPANARLLLTCLTECPDPVLGELSALSLHEPDLALSDEEALGLLASATGHHHVAHTRLIATCQGWPAAVRLAAELAAAGRSPARALDELRTEGSERLLQPVWKRLDDDVRQFLLDTAVLDDLSPDLCSEVSRVPAVDALDRLVAAHAFVRPVRSENGHVVWRRHPLLTSFLRRRRESRAGDVEVHRRSAEVAVARGDVESAVWHLLNGGQADRAVRHLREREESLYEAGDGDLVVELYRRLPPELVPDEPDLVLRLAWADVFAGRTDDARLLLLGLRRLVDAGATSDVLDLRAEEAVLSAVLDARSARFAPTLQHALRARSLFGDARDRLAAQFAAALEVLALLRLGRIDEASSRSDDLTREASATTVLVAGVAPMLVAACRHEQGFARESWQLADGAASAFALAQPGSQYGGVGTWSSLVRGLAAVELGHAAEAADDLAEATRRLAWLEDLGGELVAVEGTARLHWSHGDIATALELLRQAYARLARRSPRSEMVIPLRMLEARIRIATGDGQRAERLLRSLPDSPQRRLMWVALAHLRRPGSGTAALARIAPATPRAELEWHCTAASIELERSTRSAAVELLRAGDVVDRTGQTLGLVGASTRLLELARSVAVRDGHDGLMALVEAGELSRSARGASAEAVRISPGELELIALLPSRSGNGGLADQLGISVNTVKTRLRRLYSKLGVTTRDEAIARARALGLL